MAISRLLKGTLSSRVLVIGDIMLDKWTYHLQTRISPEADVPVIQENDSKVELGGAGNALRHLDFISSGKHELITVIGVDESGRQIREIAEISQSNVHLILDQSRKTTVKKRFFLDGSLMFRQDEEDSQDISFSIEREVLSFLKGNVHRFDVLLLSDYAKGVLTENLVKEIKSLANHFKIPIVVDPGFGKVGRYAGCTVIKPNLQEWNGFTVSVGGESKGLELLFDAGTQFVLVTLGAKGVRLITPSSDTTESPTEDVEVLDVTGAGDSIAATLSLLVGDSRPIIESLGILNLVGANTVKNPKTELSPWS